MASSSIKTSAESKPLHDVIAGALARAGSQACIHPLDTLKVRMQSGKTSLNDVPMHRNGVLLPKPVSYALSLYKGCAEAAIGAGVIIGSYFAFYSTSKLLLQQHTDMPQGTVAFISGGMAAVGSSVVKVPIAVCIRSVQAGNYKNATQAAQGIYRKAGFLGIYSGMVPTLLEDIPDSAVKFAMYESLRQAHRALTGRAANAVEDLLMGGVSGAVAAAASTPLDVIKTRMQCNAASRPSMVQAASSVWREAGARGFFFGVGPRVLSNGINSAVFFSFFEAIRSFIVRQREGDEGSRSSSSGRGTSAGAGAASRSERVESGRSASSSSSSSSSVTASRHAAPISPGEQRAVPAARTASITSTWLGDFSLPFPAGVDVSLGAVASALSKSVVGGDGGGVVGARQLWALASGGPGFADRSLGLGLEATAWKWGRGPSI